MSVATRGRYAGLLIWAAYFVVPTDAGGLIHGVPLGPLDAIALLMIAWLAASGGRLHPSAAAALGAPGLPGAPLVAIVLAVSFASAALIPGTGGFRARYFASVNATGAHERSTEYPNSAYTRVDDRLEFTPGGPEFPLAFFNDNSRFNFYRAGEPNRRQLEFAARWSGLWWVEAGPQHLYVETPQSAAEISIDGVSAMRVAAELGSGTTGITLTGGWHRLDVAFSSPYGAPRIFSAGVLRGTERRPFDATSVVTQQIRSWQMTAARALRTVKTSVDVVVLAWLAWCCALSIRQRLATFRGRAPASVRRTQALSILALAGTVEAVVFAWPWSRQLMLLNGGDDPMTYEGYARDILLNGILMNGGRPLGEGEPFYYQAFYPYFLAAVHALFGEGMFGVLLVQRLLAAVAIWKLVEIAMDLSVDAVWGVALAVATFFVCWKLWPIGSDLLTEALYVPLLVIWTGALMRACRAPTTARVLITGLLGGLTAITRSTILLSWAVVLPACWAAWQRMPRRVALVALLAITSLGVFSVIAVRNAIVAHTFAPTSTELGVTLLGGNEIPPGVTIDLQARGALYTRLGIGGLTAQVIEYAITAPGLFLQGLGRKALFALGFYEPYAPGWGYSPVYITVWMTAIAGLLITLRANPAARVPSLVPALIAVTQFVAVVVVYPKGERLIVPIHTLLVPYSAIAIWGLVRTVTEKRPA